MKPQLRAVSTELPEPPYPRTTKSNGFKFEIELERIRASKTWRLCPPDQRNNLLRIWVESWAEYPCGSWEDDDELIALACDIPVRMFQAHKDQLMRGWVLHSDGRYYHPVVSEKVLQMLSRRNSSTERQRRARTKNQGLSEDVTRDSRVTNASSHVTYAQEQEQEQGLRDKALNRALSTKVADAPSGGPKTIDSCPHKKIIDLYHEKLPMLRRVRTWEGERPKLLRARWVKHPDLEWWAGYFEYVAESDFLTGKTEKPFYPDLEWLVRPSNMQKVYEGKYHG